LYLSRNQIFVYQRKDVDEVENWKSFTSYSLLNGASAFV